MELNSKNSIKIDKNLCLFCDKAFTNNVDQENHVERDHKTILSKGKGSRRSERITKNISSSENSPFPGCFHCSKRSIRTDDLESLFQHLLTSHKDVYFGCKCKIRALDKFSLANHKKICKIGGKSLARVSAENVSDNRKSSKKSQDVKSNGESKYDSLSESEDSVSVAASTRTLSTNAIHKKSDRSKLKIHSKTTRVNEKGRKSKSSSSSTISSASSNRTGEEEYTIPLTRQKLKEPPSRLGAAQNRSSSNKKSQKTNKAAQTIDNKAIAHISPPTKALRTKSSKILNSNTQSNNLEPPEVIQKVETVSAEFDEDFYKNISQNIRVNLSSYIDGKSDRLLNRPVFEKIASTDCTSESSVTDAVYDKEIHEATNFDLSTPFPALLTAEQYGFGESNPNKHKRQITKNSWKWKWDLIKKYKYVNEGGKIVKKVKQITTGLKDLSQLDMWTQLSMRSRYQNLNITNGVHSDFADGLNDLQSTRTIKTQNIEQLNHILDKCLTPQIDIEHKEFAIIKVEPEDKEELDENLEMNPEIESEETREILSMCNLVKSNITKSSNPMLSGEWARPRCFICVDCGLKFDLMKSLNDHKNSEHPYVVSAHYEIVGRENLEQELYKNLFLPKKALQTNGFARSLSVNSDSKSNETNEASTSSDNSSKFFVDQKEKECSKCLKMIKYSSDNDIDRHILDCIEDRVWLQAKRRSKYRRSRRKNRKTTRKSRLSIDQKKTLSSPPTPSTKDNTEGENSTLSISNPPTPKNDLKNSAAITSKANKNDSSINEVKTVNGKVKDGMSIKNFFRVSKMIPAVPQKLVVQMLEIPPQTTNSLRTSLRSSSAKRSANIALKNDSASKNEEARDNSQSAEAVKSEHKIEEILKLNDLKKLDGSDDKSPLIPLTISTPEKQNVDLQLCSPTSSSSLVSPTSNVPKKKKKLNDCIAMLTCKIQEKLGVSFFEGPVEEPTSPEKPSTTTNEPITVELKIPDSKPSSSFQIDSLLKDNSFTDPVQDEVIDLSIKKKPVEEQKSVEEALQLISEDTTIVQEETKIENTHIVATSEVKESLEIDELVCCETKIEQCEPTVDDLAKEEEKINESFPEIKNDEPESSLHTMEEVLEEVVAAKEVEVPPSELPIDSDSFKISIPKEKIPNLNEILDHYQVITVNNIKISESERRAFEEQKNRILKILNKTKSLTRKIANKKSVAKKPVKRKAPARKAAIKPNSKRKEVPKPEATTVKEDFPLDGEKVEEKIEEVIKTTNRIRCRRLSVIVDPIVTLSTFQNKNRKIRLTNNSQQNGFYEILAASEQLFGDSQTKSETATEKVVDEEKPECENVCSVENIVEAKKEEKEEIVETTPTKTRAAKTIATKELKKQTSEKVVSTKKLVNSSLTKSKSKKPVEKIVEQSEDQEIEESLNEEPEVESEILPPPGKKSRTKKQNFEHLVSPVVVIEPLEESLETEKLNNELKAEESKVKQRKPVVRPKKSSLPLEEIKVEQSVKVNLKVQPVKRKKNPRGKQAQKKENRLDVSFSSDTSNENDIPLSQLITPSTANEEVKAIESDKEEESITLETELPVDVQLEKSLDSERNIIEKELIPNKEENKVDEDLEPFLNRTSSSIDLTRDDAKEKSFDPFTINEDSFFNDDLDNDPSDKINDLVNNIINSSEFQNDSESEKSECLKSLSSKDQKTSCEICKRCFRNQKGYEKHCTTNTHIMKAERKNRGMSKVQDKEVSKATSEPETVMKAPTPILDEAAKVFRTKGALKTFDGILHLSPEEEIEHTKSPECVELLPKIKLDPEPPHGNDDKLYYEFKMEKKPEDMTPKDKDQLFDSLFNSLEAKDSDSLQAPPDPISLSATPQDSEIESSSTSWDLKHDADIEWDEAASNPDNVPFANAIKERYPKKIAVKINKSKDTAVSIPTKSLIMGKIFKKHRDRETQRTPQADAPNNKPGIKNSLDEIFDHLKNSAEIDDKVLTCPSPKTLLQNAGGTFSPHSSNSNDMLETASHSNNNNVYKSKPIRPTPVVELKKEKTPAFQIFNELLSKATEDDGIGKRKSRRRCAIKAKTFAETWSSDEYEELHDTEDIMSIINEIEKRELIKKRKIAKAENHCDSSRMSESSVVTESPSKVHDIEVIAEKKSSLIQENSSKEKTVKRKSVQIHFSDEEKLEKVASNSIKKRRLSIAKEGHKSDDETFTATKAEKPTKAMNSIKKRRMSCFVPSTISFDDHPKTKSPVVKQSKEIVRMESETLRKFEKVNENFDAKNKSKKADSEKSFKNHKKFVNLLTNFGAQQSAKKKVQKHRKRPRNKVKNIAYDSDSDFELNLSKKSKAAPMSEISSSDEEEEDNFADTAVKQTHAASVSSRSSSVNEMTMTKEPKPLPNDLKYVAPSTTNFNAAISEDMNDSNACNRTKRHSSEKLYYWSSSSSESDQEQGDTADGDNEDSVVPHQPEQHGWIVGDSHKKLVTLLAHAKIKKKIN